jgi:hypothetical protein
LAAPSGPSEAWLRSTPSTVKVFVVKLELKLPLPADSGGTVPLTVTSVRASPPAADDTPSSRVAWASEPALMVPYWLLTSWLMLILVPAAICPALTFLISCRNPNAVPPPEPLAGGWVTVMSVPTPYSVCSTVACEAVTPAEAAVTVITRPTPSARPSAMRTAWRRRRRSSRQRYVKNMGRLLESRPMLASWRDDFVSPQNLLFLRPGM